MVDYVRERNIEYVMKRPGEVTTDDPVGNYLFKKFLRKSDGKIEIDRKKMSYREALDYFEAGNMTRHGYERLLSRVKKDSKSLTQMREEMQASQILKRRELIRNLFGSDLSELTVSERGSFRLAASSIGNFRKFLRPYLERRIEDYPKDYFKSSDYPEKILGFSNGGIGIDNLERTLETLRYVLDQHVGWISQGRLRYHENEELNNEFTRLRAEGSVFSLAKFLKNLFKNLK